MESAVLPARRRVDLSVWSVAPSEVALAFGLAYLLLEPRPGDLAVHVFRAELFGREGFTIWNGQWYGGHHTPAYSVLSAPLSWLVGTRVLLYEVLLPAPIVIPDRDARIVLEQLGSDELLLDVKRPGSALIRVRWSPYWLAAGGCVERAGDWTRVTASEPGYMRLSTRFSPERIWQHGRRCDDG